MKHSRHGEITPCRDGVLLYTHTYAEESDECDHRGLT